MLGELDRRVRKFVFDYLLENTTAPSVEEIAGARGIPVPEARAALERLDEAHHIKLLEGTARILMAFPFSAMSTPYRVTRADGRRYFANCAWDSVAFHVMLEEPIRVDSFCAQCGEPLSFRVKDGNGLEVDGALPIIQLRLPATEWWKDITRTCANTMVFLCSEKHLQAAEHRLSDQGSVTIQQVVQISGPIYHGKMRLDYERPPAATIRASYERAGLTGPHWHF
jgi:hypothetical protein